MPLSGCLGDGDDTVKLIEIRNCFFRKLQNVTEIAKARNTEVIGDRAADATGREAVEVQDRGGEFGDQLSQLT